MRSLGWFLPCFALRCSSNGGTLEASGAAARDGVPEESAVIAAASRLPLVAAAELASSGACVDGVCCGSKSCAAGARCDLPTTKGACAKPLAIGCTAASECESGFCVDGVCCNSACSAQCAACDAPGLVGACSAIAGAPRGGRAACAGATSTDACQRQLCNGVDSAVCHHAPKGTVLCGANACASGIETHVATCDGAGACGDTPRSCGLYVCGAGACRTKCASAADCSTGYYCDTAKSACVPLEGVGHQCSAASPCASPLACVEGYCCTKSACAADETCATPGREGNCLAKNGSTCKADADCGSQSCVDGVCCDGACTGLCEACDVTGALGTCTAVLGTPHGARGACPASGDDACAATTCDGTDRARCAKLVGADVQCRAASCEDAVLTAAASCLGTGACPAIQRSTCGAYACADATSCRSTCLGSTECAPGYACVANACVKAKSACSSDGLSVVDADGIASSCAPYYCRDAACATSCDSSADCVGGQLCEGAAHVCVPSPPSDAGGDSGGCAQGAAPARGALAALGLLAAAATTRRRRRLAPRR